MDLSSGAHRGRMDFHAFIMDGESLGAGMRRLGVRLKPDGQAACALSPRVARRLDRELRAAWTLSECDGARDGALARLAQADLHA